MKIKSKASKRENNKNNKNMIIFIFSLARLTRLEASGQFRKKFVNNYKENPENICRQKNYPNLL